MQRTQNHVPPHRAVLVLRNGAARAVCFAAVLGHALLACGPAMLDPADSDGAGSSGAPTSDVAAPVEVQPWMLGVFSNKLPDEWADPLLGVQQYHVYDNLELDVIDVTRHRGDIPCDGIGDMDRCFVKHRNWEPRTADSFAMFPGDGRAILEYIVRPRGNAPPECGPYDVVTIKGPESSDPGPSPITETIYRGAVCVRSYPMCPEDGPEFPTEPCGGVAWEWCDEPPPCEAE